MPRLLTFTLAVIVAGCASAPPHAVTVASPASPDAPAGARIARQSSLRTDEETAKTRALLGAAQKEQEIWDAYGPVSGNPEQAPRTNPAPENKHEPH